MQIADLVALTQKALWLLTMTAAPAVVASALVGLLIAVFQTATQLQDQSIGQAIKLGAVVAVLLITGGWMAQEIYAFAEEVLKRLPEMRG
jgi:type III secretion protein S